MLADCRYRRDLTEVAPVEEETSGTGIVKLRPPGATSQTGLSNWLSYN